MKRFITLLIITTLLVSCKQKSIHKLSKKVIIAGKISNFNKNNPDIKMYVNRLGADQTEVSTTADSLGNFKLSFDTYIPTDVWISYKTNFLVLTHPGDSIHLEFNGKPNNRSKILKTILFSGDCDSTNLAAAKFQEMYFSSPIYTDWDKKNRAIKECDLEEYEIYLDSLRNKTNLLFTDFVTKNKPNEEVKTWAKTYLEQELNYLYASYPDGHRYHNKLSENEWNVPLSYYDKVKTSTKIEPSKYISGYAVGVFFNNYISYVYKNILFDNKKLISDNGGILKISDKQKDSIIIDGILKYTKEPFIQQVLYTSIINQYFDEMNVRLFEKNSPDIKATITESFLIEPLLERYKQIKEHLSNPKIESDAMLKKASNSSAKEIIDSIFSDNVGKVIYLDTWATWCAPCKSEMPNSKKLMEKMKGKDVVFVYLCIDSNESTWKANLSELQISGQHYFLNQKQSTDFRKSFKVNGIPHYFLIDKKGTILEKGSHLRPNIVEEKIVGLLNK